MFHGGLDHRGLSEYDTSHVDGTVKWRFEVPDVAPTSPEFESSPAIGEDGTIYIGYAGNGLYAINPDGTEKWYYSAGEKVHDDWFSEGTYKGVIASPAVDKNGVIYFTSLSNYLFAVDAGGEEKWRYPIQRSTPVWSSPAIGEDGTIYVGAAMEGDNETSKGMFAVNSDGTLKWKFYNPGDVVAGPGIDEDGTIYVGAYDGEEGKGKMYAINPDGTQKWEFDAEEYIESSPTIVGDMIYFGSGLNIFYAINKDGEEQWRFNTPSPEVFSTPAVDKEGTIYFGYGNFEDDGFALYALNSDGSEKWKFDTPGSIETSPVIGADGTIYFGTTWYSNDGPTFYAVNPDGSEKWSASIGGVSSSPAIGKDGTVYAASHNNGVYAFGGPGEGMEEVDEEKNTSDWEPEEEIREEEFYDEPEMEYEEKGFIDAIISWFKGLFGDEEDSYEEFEDEPFYERDYEKEDRKPFEKKEICLMKEEYEFVEPILSLPFDLEDYYPGSWGIVPFCADLIHSKTVHNAFDFELRKEAKVYAAADGVIVSTSYNDEEGAGEIMNVEGDGYSLDYSGLLNIKLDVGDSMKKGDYVADVYQTPYGEYHVHLGISIGDGSECPLKYMDDEFREAFEEMFRKADYSSQTSADCACECEFIESR